MSDVLFLVDRDRSHIVESPSEIVEMMQGLNNGESVSIGYPPYRRSSRTGTCRIGHGLYPIIARGKSSVMWHNGIFLGFLPSFIKAPTLYGQFGV